MEVIELSDFSEDVLQESGAGWSRGLHLSGRKSESKGVAFSRII